MRGLSSTLTQLNSLEPLDYLPLPAVGSVIRAERPMKVRWTFSSEEPAGAWASHHPSPNLWITYPSLRSGR